MWGVVRRGCVRLLSSTPVERIVAAPPRKRGKKRKSESVCSIAVNFHSSRRNEIGCASELRTCHVNGGGGVTLEAVKLRALHVYRIYTYVHIYLCSCVYTYPKTQCSLRFYASMRTHGGINSARLFP